MAWRRNKLVTEPVGKSWGCRWGVPGFRLDCGTLPAWVGLLGAANCWLPNHIARPPRPTFRLAKPSTNTHAGPQASQLMSLPTSDPDISPLTDQLTDQTTREHYPSMFNPSHGQGQSGRDLNLIGAASYPGLRTNQSLVTT